MTEQDFASRSTPQAMEELANDASPFTIPKPDETAAQANKRLADGLNRVRGEAIQRAKNANSRMRVWAMAGTAASFALGAALGYFISSRRCARAMAL